MAAAVATMNIGQYTLSTKKKGCQALTRGRLNYEVLSPDPQGVHRRLNVKDSKHVSCMVW